MERKPTYLIMVTTENNNKYYNCFPEGSQFRVEYGRVDSTKTTVYYPIEKWDSQIQSKLKKGYKDITHLKTALVEEIKKDSDGKSLKQIENEAIRKIIAKLQSIARQTIDKNYTVKSSAVTQEMVDEAQEVIDSLVNEMDTYTFNNSLLKLFSILPRKMDNVKYYLAYEPKDFKKIITREQNLLDVMRGQIYVPTDDNKDETDDNVSDKTILDEMGITMEECSTEDTAVIKKLMAESAYHFSRAWKVTNLKTQKRFDDFVKANNIKETKLLFHGSRSENWYSILKTGLKIRPANVVITGSMFGSKATYFSPKCQKSIGYTSLGGSYWANGKDNVAYMGVFNTAYGKPYDVYSFDSKYYTMEYDKLPSGCNCLHAHAGSMLRNDEIVYYKEEQSTIKYLIEIK